MLKELKIFFYLISIFLFFFFILKFYFSDENKKKSYRSFSLIDKKIETYSKNLITLESDTKNNILYIDSNITKNKKTFKFWKLLIND
jgi:hypothetical protein